MTTTTIKFLSTLLAEGKTSSVELCQDYLARIKKHNDLNAFITVDPDYTLKQAEQADHARSHKTAGLLSGIPIAQKDIFCTKGMKTSCGSRMLDNFIAPYDATVIQKFNAAGCVTLGKTNMDEFAMGSSNETSYFGAVKNPWDTTSVPGGSSGGSAAAVAARLAPAATGTDTGGSIRQPAAFTGITGLKPSYGRVSRYGMIAFASSLDQGGPMTQTVEDAALLLNVMAGFDPRDSTSVDQPVPDFSIGLDKPIKGLRIGLPKQYFTDGLDDEVAQIIEKALDEYKKLGAKIVDIELANSDLAVPCYYVLAPSEASSNLSRFDGVRYGHRASEYTDLTDMYMRTRAEGFGDEVKRRIMIGAYALSSGYYDAYYLKAQKLRRLITNDFDRAFEQCDVIMGPTTPTTAFGFNSRSGDPVAMYLNDIYTISVNLAGLPGISIPAGFDPNNKPVGLHIIAPYFDESRLLNVAHQYQKATDWHQQVPVGFSS